MEGEGGCALEAQLPAEALSRRHRQTLGSTNGCRSSRVPAHARPSPFPGLLLTVLLTPPPWGSQGVTLLCFG